MIYDRILVKYGELSIKGRNKKAFIDKINDTIRRKCSKLTNLKFERQHDLLYIILNGVDYQEVVKCLNKVFGLHSYSLCAKCSNDIEEIKNLALEIVNHEIIEKTTFKVETNRANKNFPNTSLEVSQIVARHVLKGSPQLVVDVKKPQVTLKIDIRLDGTYIMTKEILGLGGLPVGIDGKGLVMMSGGIDSPVSGYLALKRGVLIDVIHYASPPYTSDLSKQKVVDITQKLAKYSPNGKIKLYIIPFTNLQTAIYENCPGNYAITIMRRMMYRIAEKLATINNDLIIINGENLGQVASQTLYSMQAINNVTTMPIIRPVVTMDKLEIIDIAKKIETYDISIRPHEDCCTIFVPENPVTKPEINKCINYESSFDYQSLINECVENIEIIEIEENKYIDIVNKNPLPDLF